MSRKHTDDSVGGSRLRRARGPIDRDGSLRQENDRQGPPYRRVDGGHTGLFDGAIDRAAINKELALDVSTGPAYGSFDCSDGRALTLSVASRG